MPRELSAGAVIFRRAKREPEFLVLRYGLGHWDFAKGNIKKGEHEKETVVREVAEETGIRNVRFVEGYREVIRYFYLWKGQGIFKIVVFYLVETRRRKVSLSHEHIGYRWLPYEEARKQLTFKNSELVLLRARNILKGKSN